MSSSTSGVEMVQQFFTTAGTLIGDMLPLLYLFLGVFAGLLCVGLIAWAVTQAIKKVTR